MSRPFRCISARVAFNALSGAIAVIVTGVTAVTAGAQDTTAKNDSTHRAATLEGVSVTAGRLRPLLDTKTATTGGSVGATELRALPTDARNPIDLAFTIPGVAQATGFYNTAPQLSIDGSNSLYTQYYIDGLDNNEGFLGGPRIDFPLAALSLLQVKANTYGADIGRSSNGVVDYITKSGTDVPHGELFVYGRPGASLDGRPAFTPANVDRGGFRRYQVGAAAGGPLAAWLGGARTHAFGAAEYVRERESQTVITGYGNGAGEALRDRIKLFGRLDHDWNSRQQTTLHAAFSNTRLAGLGTGNIVPEADFTQQRIGFLAALTQHSRIGRGISNTFWVQIGTYHWFYPPTSSTFNVPQVTILDAMGAPKAVVGSSGFQFDERELQLNLKDVAERTVGAHHLQIGGDMISGHFRLTGAGTDPAGSYVVVDNGQIHPAGSFVSVRDIPSDVTVKSYTVDVRQQHIVRTQSVVGAFVQDSWLPAASVTLSLGLRWDYDDLTSHGGSKPDLNNFQPRTSVNWTPDRNSVVRAGFGVYTGKLPYTIYSDALQFGRRGAAVVTLDGASAPRFGSAPSQAALSAAVGALPPVQERALFALGLQSPTSYQTSLGYQHKFGDAWGVSVDGVWVETRHLPRLWDLNAVQRPIGPADSVDLPAAAGDPYRPIQPVVGSFRQLLTTETGGRGRYLGLNTALRHRLTDAWTADLSWVWSHAQNNTDDINFVATQGNNFGLEWADAVNDRRHKVDLRTVYTLEHRVKLAGIASFQTGTPINRIANFRDLDGSGASSGNFYTGNFDRYYGVARNGERLPSVFELNTSVGYLIPVGSNRVELRADVFNALNSTLESGFANGISGGGPRTQVGRPGDPIVYTIAGRPREVQLSAQYAF
ncbi:MAG: TonB-dependent receptor plug domain-containing protein [Gemmatimonadaceae bacterium]